MSPASPYSESRLALPGAWEKRDWIALGSMVLLAALVRVVFFTGYFGSDDVNSSEAAIAITNGQWPATRYLASLRYGISLPMAAFITIFGLTEFTATAWALVCSVAEVALVFGVARAVWDLRAAVLAGGILGLTPLHVHLGGQPTGDAPLALFVTLSLALFLIAETRRHPGWYLATGLAVGCTFWVKESAIVYTGVFVVYALVRRTWNARWLWVIVGAGIVVTANALLFLALTGDAFHYFKVIVQRRQVHEAVISSRGSQPVWLYFYYLFVDLRHTWLLSYLTLGGLLVWLTRGADARRASPGARFVVIWGLGLFGVLTFLVIKLQPLTFIFKQTNYMLIFLAPFALLGGFFLASLRTPLLVPVLLVFVTGGVALSGLEQQAIRSFTANSRAAWVFAKEHAAVPIFATEHAVNMASILSRLDHSRDGTPRIKSLAAARSHLADGRAGDAALKEPGTRAYVIIDFETISWGDDPRIGPRDIPGCWQRVMQLEPLGLGAGARVASALRRAADWLPGAVGRKLAGRLDGLIRPKPAFAYRIPADCTATV